MSCLMKRPRILRTAVTAAEPGSPSPSAMTRVSAAFIWAAVSASASGTPSAAASSA